MCYAHDFYRLRAQSWAIGIEHQINNSGILVT